MDEDAIWNLIFANMEQWRRLQTLRSYTTLAYAGMAGNPGYLVGSMNSASGLVSASYRSAIPDVRYYSVSSRASGRDIVQLVPNGEIVRANNRHAEMNVVMYAMYQHLSAGGDRKAFVLDNYLTSLSPSQHFCPECQLAICLLSRAGSELVRSITEHVMSGGEHTLVMRGISNHMLSDNWQPPWADYFADIAGSDFFRNLQGNDRNAPYLVGYEGRQAVIYRRDGNGYWDAVSKIGVRHG